MRRTSGFSLGEAIVALTLMSLVALVVVQLFVSSLRTVQSSGLRQQALQLAGQQLALLQSKSFGDLQPGVQNLPAPAQGDFQTRAEVLSQPQTPHLLELRVTVTWTESGGPRKLIRRQLKANVER